MILAPVGELFFVAKIHRSGAVRTKSYFKIQQDSEIRSQTWTPVHLVTINNTPIKFSSGAKMAAETTAVEWLGLRYGSESSKWWYVVQLPVWQETTSVR